MYRYRFHAVVMWFISGMTAALTAALAAAPAPAPVEVRAIAEVESEVVEHGHKVRKLLPADRVVSGDWIIYTLEVRNTAPTAIPSPTVTYPVPEHMSYVADSAVGPATEVSFSVDGGHSFDVPENLKLQDADGQPRPAAAAEYTHIRWQLKHGLKSNSVAFVRFRARVK
jgi:uncharacterized repeat protein (TIGR01451 family)